MEVYISRAKGRKRRVNPVTRTGTDEKEKSTLLFVFLDDIYRTLRMQQCLLLLTFLVSFRPTLRSLWFMCKQVIRG